MSGEAGPSSVPDATPRLPWRRRHPRRARVILYGAALAVLGAGALVASHLLEKTRQDGLFTRLHGVGQMFLADPEGVIAFVRTEVLDQRPDEDVRRTAQLTVAACLDVVKRYDESERTYAEVAADWPADLPRGPLTVPWANMRINAGRPGEALTLMAPPGATVGWEPASQVDEVRARAWTAVGPVPSAPSEVKSLPAGGGAMPAVDPSTR
jgi:hypothetical protein